MRFRQARDGCVWVLTEKGCINLPAYRLMDRRAGDTLPGREKSVPVMWANQHWVAEWPERFEQAVNVPIGEVR